ncbi:hypothetical protein AX17_003367 [Amanita inopinata Kibby_2008]|nr:hypothetical protein AX17_003367 [Amanita inopinata Kibby_2008]
MPGRKQLRQTTLSNFSLSEPRSRRLVSTRLKRKRTTGHRSSTDDDTAGSMSGSDDAQAIQRGPTMSMRKAARVPVKKRKISRVVESDTDDRIASQALANEHDVNQTMTSASKGKARQVQLGSSQSDLDSPTSRSRLVKEKKQAQESSDEEVDLEEEVDKKHILNTRLRVRGKKTAFQRSLEKLKRRKQKKLESPSESESDSQTESERGTKPIKGARPYSDRDSLFSEDSDASDDSSNFIVEDDGVVPQPLPMQFSMQTHEELSLQFKKVFQFFVHIAVRPAVERHKFMSKQMKVEQYFSLPMMAVRRKITGIRDTLVASSVWQPEFKKSLEKYPEFDLAPLGFAVPECDACHLGGRRSTLVGHLGGFPYDRLGFEMIIDLDSDSEGDGDANKSHDLEFHLGRFCGKRTRVFHEMSHWEYALFKCILQEVDDLHAAKQSKGFIRVAYAGRKRPPDDLEDADAICEWLDERKIIDMEWKRIKDIMESSGHLDMIVNKEDL